MRITSFDPENKPSIKEKQDMIDFLFKNLDEFGDDRDDIEKCVDYALKESMSFGGFILEAFEEDIISSVVVVNKTGMKGFIPENILVYIATHREMRGRGIGKALINKAIDMADGSLALHVEPNNPAKFLYEKIGFTNKYLEMRYIKK
ncbi:MAG: GNAT family N-acetyltransferase [Bacteroidales bacterium]|nr:GNAT family N-acetyltransferase [Bacteroidales bacterium]